ncbi:GTP cyclohydrolase II-domain-containing protein [Chytridium lagenaria]|nr:GTP cyclohydrolase II-domain-containing protein [Chytridium lagenaria]
MSPSIETTSLTNGASPLPSPLSTSTIVNGQEVVVPMIVQCHQLQGNATRRPSAPPIPAQAPSTAARLAAAGSNSDLLHRISVLEGGDSSNENDDRSRQSSNPPAAAPPSTNLSILYHFAFPMPSNHLKFNRPNPLCPFHRLPHPNTRTHKSRPPQQQSHLPSFFHSHNHTSSPTTARPPLTVQCEVRTRIPSEWGGEPQLLLYSNNHDAEEHLAILHLDRLRDSDTDSERAVRGARPVNVGEAVEADTEARKMRGVVEEEPPLARIHSCCFTGETLGSVRCDCREQLQEAMRLMAIEGRGVILYLKQEGRGIGLKEKLRAYNLIDQGYDTMEANVMLGQPPDARDYDIASAILRDLRIASVRLLTNNPDKLASVQRGGVTVASRVPMVPLSWGTSAPSSPPLNGSSMSVSAQDRDEYLVAKVQRMGHILDIPKHVLEAVGGSGKRGSMTDLTNGKEVNVEKTE